MCAVRLDSGEEQRREVLLVDVEAGTHVMPITIHGRARVGYEVKLVVTAVVGGYNTQLLNIVYIVLLIIIYSFDSLVYHCTTADSTEY